MPDDLRDQFPKVREVVAALRIPVYELAGYEADDVIGTIIVDAERRGLDTTIVTGDLDMLQLVSDRTRLMTTRSGVENTILYDPARIEERFGLVAGQMIDYKALKGDPSDNIPGVPGVGEKTAAKLIRKYGDLDGIFAHLDEQTPKLRANLEEFADRARANFELMTLRRDAPIEVDFETLGVQADDAEVQRLFDFLEFRPLYARSYEALRVVGHPARCKASDGGGNRGRSQLGRIAAAPHGVLLDQFITSRTTPPVWPRPVARASISEPLRTHSSSRAASRTVPPVALAASMRPSTSMRPPAATSSTSSARTVSPAAISRSGMDGAR